VIIVQQDHFAEIVKYSLDQYPSEACGLLGGRIEGELRIVEKIYGLTNVDKSPDHFSMDPKEQFSAIKDMRQSGLVMLGNYHSHSASPARPSDEDKRLAFDPDASYLMLSLLDRKNPVLKSFNIKKELVWEEEIKFG